MKVTFGKFERPAPGDECNGRVIFVDGAPVPGVNLRREITWTDVGVTRASYVPTITGYTVDLGEQPPQTFDTLAEAQGAVRKHLTKEHMNTYVADSNPEKLKALQEFITEGVRNDAHKKLIQKYRIATGRGGWTITDEAKAHAIVLGWLT